MPVDLFEKYNIELPSGEDIKGGEDIEQAPNLPGSWLQKASEGAQKYVINPVERARLPEIAGGGLQGAYDVARSIGNLPLEALSKLTGSTARIPSIDLQKYTKQDPISRATFMGGELAGAAGPVGKTFGSLEKLLGSSSLGRRALTGGLTGFAAGEQGDEESGRLPAAAIGAALPVASSALSKSLAKRLMQNKQAMNSRFENQYGSIFDALKNEGLHKKNMAIPQLLKKGEGGTALANLKTSAPREFTRALDVFTENPTFENAHSAQSDLGKLSRYLESQAAGRAARGQEVSSTKGKAADLAKSLQKRLRGSMQDFLLKNERPDLVNAYGNTTKQYAQEMVPYFHHAIAKHGQNKLGAAKMINQLMKSEDFMNSPAAKDLAGIGVRKALSSKPVQIAGGLAAAPLLYEFGLPAVARGIENIQEAAR